jgi:DNA mismatch repair protein MutS
MDEIGRGTSTYDGISIAWAIVEYLHNHTPYCPKTLFATHYHELNQLAEQLARVKNFHVTVKEVVGKILFLRKLMPGGSEHSFGIHVAQLAGMPKKIVERANDMLAYLEKREDEASIKNKIKTVPVDKTYQLSLFDPDPNLGKVKTMITDLQIDTLSPIEALLKLKELKDILT